MARKFLYVIAILIALFIAGRIAIGFWYQDLATVALVPSEEWQPAEAVKASAYADKALWISRPDIGAGDPAQWHPDGFTPEADKLAVAVFFIHPTSYLSRAHWNAPLDDKASRDLAERIVRGIASPFNRAQQLWVPRFRQATFGAFLTKGPEGQAALDLAYGDVDAAFTEFVAKVDPKLPIVIAGHSQGSYLLRRLVQQRVAGTPLAARMVAAYPIGWPVSVEHDLPAMKMPACTAPDQTGCVISWLSFGAPAETADMLRDGARIRGLDGQPIASGSVVCTNPLTGIQGGSAPASTGLGTMKPDAMLKDGKLVPQLTGASCTAEGALSIGAPVEMGPYTLPGNNYHVYDIPLFWANLRADFARRTSAWKR